MELTTVGKVLSDISGSIYKDQIMLIRQLKADGKKEEADEVKINLHAVTFCATFKSRRISSLYQNYNSLMVLDIDKLSENEIERVGECLGICPVVACYWKSPSGLGWKGLVPLKYINADNKTDVVEMHHWAFNKLEEFLKMHYSIILDASGKDITRLCFMSWSPELKIKDMFESFCVDLNEMKSTQTGLMNSLGKHIVYHSSGNPICWNTIDGLKQENRTGTPHDRRIIERIYKFLKARNESITSSYEDWVKVAFAIAQTFHSTYGRKIFLKLCELDGANHNEARSERLIYDAYATQMRRCDFSSIIYLATRKGFIR